MKTYGEVNHMNDIVNLYSLIQMSENLFDPNNIQPLAVNGSVTGPGSFVVAAKFSHAYNSYVIPTKMGSRYVISANRLGGFNRLGYAWTEDIPDEGVPFKVLGQSMYQTGQLSTVVQSPIDGYLFIYLSNVEITDFPNFVIKELY